MVWSAIGVLQAKGDPTYSQTSSVGLVFIAIPAMSSLVEDGQPWIKVFFVFLWFAGLGSSFSYV